MARDLLHLLVCAISFSMSCYFGSLILLLVSHQPCGESVEQTCFGFGIITYIIHLHIGPIALIVPIEPVLLLQSMSATRTLPSFNQYRWGS